MTNARLLLHRVERLERTLETDPLLRCLWRDEPPPDDTLPGQGAETLSELREALLDSLDMNLLIPGRVAPDDAERCRVALSIHEWPTAWGVAGIARAREVVRLVHRATGFLTRSVADRG